MGIEQYRLYTIAAREDLAEAYDRGLLDVDFELFCEACDLPVGEDLEEFEPFAIVLNKKEQSQVWLVCEACHYDTTHPTDELD